MLLFFVILSTNCAISQTKGSSDSIHIKSDHLEVEIYFTESKNNLCTFKVKNITDEIIGLNSTFGVRSSKTVNGKIVTHLYFMEDLDFDLIMEYSSLQPNEIIEFSNNLPENCDFLIFGLTYYKNIIEVPAQLIQQKIPFQVKFDNEKSFTLYVSNPGIHVNYLTRLTLDKLKIPNLNKSKVKVTVNTDIE